MLLLDALFDVERCISLFNIAAACRANIQQVDYYVSAWDIVKHYLCTSIDNIRVVVRIHNYWITVHACDLQFWITLHDHQSLDNNTRSSIVG